MPGESVLGELGEGYKYTASILNEGRIGVGAQMVGLAQGCLDATVPYTLQHKQFGQRLFNFQVRYVFGKCSLFFSHVFVLILKCVLSKLL